MTSARVQDRPPPTGTEVAPGVFVGGWVDAARFSGAKICVRSEAPEGMSHVTHLPVYDEEREEPIRPNLDRVVDAIRAKRANGETVLVFCGHGVRRGPLAVAWYLHRTDGISLDAAFARVAAVRPQIEHVRAWARHWRTLDSPPPTSD
jgi:protein-tyrosine phosphatase